MSQLLQVTVKCSTANATTIVIPALSQRTGQRTPLPYPHAYTRVKDFLKEKLQKDLGHYVANRDSVLATSIFKVLCSRSREWVAAPARSILAW
jgi:hypothetical protein